MKYTDILNSKIVNSTYDEIELKDDSPYYHGMKHIQATVKIMKDLIKILKIDEKTADKLLISIILHDIGKIKEGTTNHEINGKYIAKNLLEDIGYSDTKEILEAIEFHDTITGIENLSSFTLLVALADKLDLTDERIKDNYREDNNIIYNHILEIELFKNDELIINFISDKKTETKTFFEINFVKWMLKILKTYCDKENLKYNILFDNNAI